MISEEVKGTSKNLSFDHLILYPSPKGEGQAEFLEVPLTYDPEDKIGFNNYLP